MRLLHIAPTFFDDASVIGGAERYTWELAKAMAEMAEVSLLTFGPVRRAEHREGVAIQQLRRLPIIERPLWSNPVNWRFLRAIGRADVVHCHQVDTLPTAV